MIQFKTVLAAGPFVLLSTAGIAGAADKCVDFQTKVSPGMVMDWKASTHSQNDVTCSTCHGKAQNPRACQTCHMGYDHPQWEMWSSSLP